MTLEPQGQGRLANTWRHTHGAAETADCVQVVRPRDAAFPGRVRALYVSRQWPRNDDLPAHALPERRPRVCGVLPERLRALYVSLPYSPTPALSHARGAAVAAVRGFCLTRSRGVAPQGSTRDARSAAPSRAVTPAASSRTPPAPRSAASTRLSRRSTPRAQVGLPPRASPRALTTTTPYQASAPSTAPSTTRGALRATPRSPTRGACSAAGRSYCFVLLRARSVERSATQNSCTAVGTRARPSRCFEPHDATLQSFVPLTRLLLVSRSAPCSGIAGGWGTPGAPGNGGVPPPGYQQGQKGSALPPTPTSTKWKAGETATAMWGVVANHGGGAHVFPGPSLATTVAHSCTKAVCTYRLTDRNDSLRAR
jgi:hypothetical protein